MIVCDRCTSTKEVVPISHITMTGGKKNESELLTTWAGDLCLQCRKDLGVIVDSFVRERKPKP